MKLPKHVHQKGPSLYYVRGNKWTWLCKADAPEEELIGSVWRLLNAGREDVKTIANDYLANRLPRKALATQADYERIIRNRIIPIFGDMRPDDLSSKDIAMYLEKRDREGHGSRGNKEVAVLSSVLNHGMRMGKVAINPTIGVSRNSSGKRTFYVENESLRLALRNSPEGFRHLLWAAYLTGFRQRDLMNMNRDHITPEGIRIIQSKDGKHILMAWSESLRRVVRRSLERSKCQYVFTNEHGQKWTTWGVQSAMRRMRAKTGVEWRFHDLRAKAESDHETGLGLMTRYNRARHLKAVK